MNKPAPKEPSMDEILSSIRQIIADDDAMAAPRRSQIQPAAPAVDAAPAIRPAAQSLHLAAQEHYNDDEDLEPLTLSRSQIVSEHQPEEYTSMSKPLSYESLLAEPTPYDQSHASSPETVEPDDVGFEQEATPSQPIEPEPVRAAQPAAAWTNPLRLAKIADASPMPDATLSQDIADKLIEPATNAAVRHTFAKLNNAGIGTQGLTIEAMLREMLRPMLKGWLDENLPSVVERLVEKEIARITRGEG